MGDPVLNRFVTRFRFNWAPRLGFLGLRRRRVSDFGAIDALPDRTRIGLCGRVYAREALPCFLSTGLAVVRRFDFVCEALDARLNRGYVHESGYDFDLEDDHGARVRVLVGEATVAPEVVFEYQRAPVDKVLEIFEALPIPNPDRYHGLRGIEYLVKDGQEIEVVGTKTRVADRGGEAVLRDVAWRSAIAAELLRTHPRSR